MSGGCKCRSSSMRGVISAPTNQLAGFEASGNHHQMLKGKREGNEKTKWDGMNRERERNTTILISGYNLGSDHQRFRLSATWRRMAECGNRTLLISRLHNDNVDDI